MTVSDQDNRTSAVGTGAEQTVPFTFPITANSDLTVIQRVTATGEETPLSETTNYTVVNNGENGGSITTVTPFVASTAQIHIIRDTPNTQTLDLEQGGNFNAENIEDALDRNTKLTIESSDSLDRTIKFTDTDPLTSIGDIPNSVDRASKQFGFDSAGKPTAITAVPEGSIAFTTIGEDIAEAADTDAVVTLLQSYTSETQTGDIIVKEPWADIRAFGAVDGADCTVAIAAALAASMNVFIPAGTWFSDPFSVPSGVSIRGISYISSIIKLNASSDDTLMTIASGSSHSQFADFELDGNKANNASTSYAMRAEQCNSMTFNRVKFDNANNGGLLIESGNLLRFNDCSVNGNLDFGAKIGGLGGTPDLTCEQVSFYACNFSNNENYNLWYLSNDDEKGHVNTVTGCWFESEAAANTIDHILVQADSLYVTANKMQVQFLSGIAIHVLAGSQSNNINANVFLGPLGGASALVFDSGATGNIAIGNHGTADHFNGVTTDSDGSNYVVEHKEGRVASRYANTRTIPTMPDEATPSVKGSDKWLTGGTTSITDFDDGREGQMITIIAEHSVIIAFGSDIQLSDNGNFVMRVGDTLTLIRNVSGVWYEVSRGLSGTNETVTVGSPTLSRSGTTQLDSSGGAITATMPNGTVKGAQKTIIMTDATTSSTVSVSSHITSDPEVFTFAEVNDTLVLIWTSTKWVTMFNNGVAV
jgi:hypothetical protein